MVKVDKQTLVETIALIDGGLDSLKFSAPENAHIFYERFENASSNLKALLQSGKDGARGEVPDLDEAQSYIDDLHQDIRIDWQSAFQDLGCAESCETTADFIDNIDSARAAIEQMLTKLNAFRKEWVL